jgi:hypothetical protein
MMTTPIPRPFDAYRYATVCGLLEIDAMRAARDPILAMRAVASADDGVVTRVLVAIAGDCADTDKDEDARRLMAAFLVSRLCLEARRILRTRSASSGHALA